jgi:hypothetical protein
MQPLPKDYVSYLPRNHYIPHLLGDDIWIKPNDSLSHHEEVHRICAACKAVRVTILFASDSASVEWREPSGVVWPQGAGVGCARGGQG